ncbi:MAG: methyltransferase domain-containing protein [Alphaproteobacteria bacterium]
MSSAASLKAESSDPSAKISFRERFMAWWDGFDSPGHSAPRLKVRTPTHEVRYETPEQRWETTRLRLVQDVWGEGFSSPGGAEHVAEMVKFFGLNPAMSVLDLGAGLGGATRTMCENYGVWVNGFEADENLAEAANSLSLKAGLAKRASIVAFDPDTFTGKAKSADCVFSKEFLYTVKDKQEFLRTVETIMKSRGQLLFTDYMLAKPHLRSESIETWMEYEPNGAHPWAESDYRQVLEEMHLDIRVVEDTTDSFQKMVTSSWAAFIRIAKTAGLSPEIYPALADEVELWARRMQAMEAGDLKVCRIHALKRDTDRLMADW